jgi:hypothetical protein
MISGNHKHTEVNSGFQVRHALTNGFGAMGYALLLALI